MKTETREIYKCEYCNKLYQIKKWCEYHELLCKKRPDYLRPCHSCIHIEKVNETIFADYGGIHGEEIEITVNVLYCKKIDSFIYPPSVAVKGNAFDMGYQENIEMPKTCEYFIKIS